MPWLDSLAKLLNTSAKIVGGLALGCTILRWLFVDRLSNDIPGLKDGLLVAAVVFWSVFGMMVAGEAWAWGKRKLTTIRNQDAVATAMSEQQKVILSRLFHLERECIQTLAFLVRRNQQEVFGARSLVLDILCNRGLMVESGGGSVWDRGYRVVDFVWDYLCQPENKARLEEIPITIEPPWRTDF